MKSILRRLIGLIELLFGIGMFIMFIKNLHDYGFDVRLNIIPPALISVGFMYYGKKYLFNEINIFKDAKTLIMDEEYFEESVEMAQETLPFLIEKIQEETDGYYIKFSIENYKREPIIVWGLIHNHEGNFFNVSIIGKLKKKNAPRTRRVSVLDTEVLDWMIKTAEGETYGAYQARARANIARTMGYRLDKKSRNFIESMVD